MAGLNRWEGIGNLGKDPEVRYAQSGVAVCTLRVACTTRVKKGEEWIDETEWVDVVTFGKMAENVGQYLKKGSKVYVSGRMQTQQYKDKEGHDRWRTQIVAAFDNGVMFLDSKGGGGPRTNAPKPNKPAGGTGEPGADADPGDGFIDDDLPF